MDIKDWLKPEYFRFVLLGIALAILGRAAFYLVTNTPLALFDGKLDQRTIETILGVEVPMALMTILWPLVFAMANLVHEGVRVADGFFYAVLAVHSAACLIAAGMIFLQPMDSIMYEYGEATLFKWEVVVSILVLTAISVVASVALFSRRVRLFGGHQVDAQRA